MTRNFRPLRTNEVVGSDHPLSVLPNATENAFRGRVKENFDTLWDRVNRIIQDLRDISETQEAAADVATTVLPGAPGSGTPFVPASDEFRHAASMVNFRYDFYEITRSGSDIIQVNFKLTGATIATLTISYNLDNQPEVLYMNGANTGIITLTYNDDGYLNSMVRI